MILFSPPIVNESNPLALFPSDTSIIRPNSSAGIVLVDSTESSLFIGTFVMYISDRQGEGKFSVFCRVSSIGGVVTTRSTVFSVFVGNAHFIIIIISVHIMFYIPLLCCC